MSAPQKTVGVEQALEIWHRRKWLALYAFAISFSLLASFIAFLPDVYRSSAILLIESQQVPPDFVRSTVTSAVERRLQTISQGILSRARLEGLIGTFGLYADLKKQFSPEEIIERMRGDISLELKGVDQRSGSGSGVAFTITYVGADPQKVSTVANTLASFFIEEDLKTRERQAGGTADFLKSQLEEMKKKLDVQEDQVSKFKEEHIGELPEQRDANLATLERLSSEIMLNNEKQIRARESVAMLQRQIAGTGSSEPSRPDALVARMARLKAELADLRSRYSEKYPDVIRVREELARLQQKLADPREEPSDVGADPYVLQLQSAIRVGEAELRVLSAEGANLRRTSDQYQARVENAPKREQEFQERTRDYRTTQEVYSSLLKRYEESKIAESMEHRQKGEQFRVLDPAIPSQKPAAPKRPRLLAVGLALSVALAVGLAFVAEQLDTSFHSVEDLRSLSQIPVLVSIPRIVSRSDQIRARRLRWIAAVSSAVGLLVIIGGSYAVARGNQRLVTLIASLGGRGG